jgi:hypothetical protein
VITVPALSKRRKEKKKKRMEKTYNSEDSHVVTHHTTNWPARGLCAVDSRVDAAQE